MKTGKVKFLSLLIFLILLAAPFFGQETYSLDYYGVISSEIDSNIYKMTSDLYYTQLCEIDDLIVSDMRTNQNLTKEPLKEQLSKENLSFYAIIEKSKTSTTWIATLNIIDNKKNLVKTESKEYDSYYKILMEPKSVLQDSLRKLITLNTNYTFKQEIKKDTLQPEEAPKDSAGIGAIENLAGTWTGEAGVSKIVIMRGGRGFVIFENGASMNITINLNNSNQLIISQNGKPNASFYPDIPRPIALTAALDCEPIKWTFNIVDDNKLEGIKNTLILKDEAAVKGEVAVSWLKRN